MQIAELQQQVSPRGLFLRLLTVCLTLSQLLCHIVRRAAEAVNYGGQFTVVIAVLWLSATSQLSV